MKDNSIINQYEDQKTRNKQGRCKIREPKWAETMRESKKVIFFWISYLSSYHCNSVVDVENGIEDIFYLKHYWDV